jgi:uncharacterized protein (TIGR03067 family)
VSLNGGAVDAVGTPESITFTGGRYQWTNPADEADQFTGTMRIDPTKNPRTMDLISNRDGDMDKGKPRYCIYELKDDVLTIAMTEPFTSFATGKSRPKSFSSEGVYVYVFTK